MMSKSVQFFATKNDLLNILRGLEDKSPLQYVRAGRFSSASPEKKFRSEEILDLGTARNGSSVSCDSYLVGLRGLEVQPRQLSGSRPFAFDQLLNPKTISLTPGGFWGKEILIRGTVGTASKDSASLEIMKLFRAAFKKSFSDVKGIYLGPEAEELWKQGKRLTGAEQSPVEFDLVP